MILLALLIVGYGSLFTINQTQQGLVASGGDTITTINVAAGVARGKVRKIVRGNAEKLTP